jgi:hypothetical protein
MKHIFSISILIVIIGAFLSCDGRDRVNKNAANNNYQNTTKVKSKIYIPSAYSEKITDTIYKDNYHIYIKQYTVSSRSIEVNNDTVYKDFNADIKVTLKDKVILNETFNVKHYAMKNQFKEINFKDFYLKNIWTDSLNIEQPEVQRIIIEFYNPTKKKSQKLELTPFDGYYNLKKIE